MSEALTNEKIRKKFKNNFDLCNFAINIARTAILSGTQATLDEFLVMINDRADAHLKNDLSPGTQLVRV
ncbi:MAG TPA: hypothetical protein VLF94_03540 [Chlamydiales bacterium]|nr:hypothetical protein [Chlamydiales bacterium]